LQRINALCEIVREKKHIVKYVIIEIRGKSLKSFLSIFFY